MAKPYIESHGQRGNFSSCEGNINYCIDNYWSVPLNLSIICDINKSNRIVPHPPQKAKRKQTKKPKTGKIELNSKSTEQGNINITYFAWTNEYIIKSAKRVLLGYGYLEKWFFYIIKDTKVKFNI